MSSVTFIHPVNLEIPVYLIKQSQGIGICNHHKKCGQCSNSFSENLFSFALFYDTVLRKC